LVGFCGALGKRKYEDHQARLSVEGYVPENFDASNWGSMSVKGAIVDNFRGFMSSNESEKEDESLEKLPLMAVGEGDPDAIEKGPTQDKKVD